MDNYQWTQHSLYKLKQYGLSQQRIKRVIRVPERIEEGIVPKTVACMQKAGSQKHPYEIWVMYQIGKPKTQIPESKQNTLKKAQKFNLANRLSTKKLKIISAWRYPGISPKNSPIPSEILEEIGNIL